MLLSGEMRGTVKPEGLSSLPVNVVVTEILDAARRPESEGKTVRLGRCF